VALRRPRTERSYPTPITNFDDRNRERYIARSGGIGSIAPNPMAGTIVDYALGKGGRMAPSYNAPIGEVLKRNLMIPEVEINPEYRETLDESLTPIGLFGPGPGLGDPTGEGGIIQRFGEMLGLIDPIDPENEGLPMDEFQEYDPNNPNMFMLPEGMDLDDMPMEDIIKQMQEPRIEASADTYTLPNLLQMLEDARNAGNEDEIELLTNDLELLYPGATMTI
tara:strand:- start:382 stop:1047 length:666 start_codon:yes stop_codon:yes gene_type:complete